MYQPLRVFTALGFFVALIGLIPMVRFLYFYVFEDSAGKIQSLVVGSALLTVGVLTFFMGLVADLLNHNRALIEMALEKIRRLVSMPLSDRQAALAKDESVPNKLNQRRSPESKNKRGDVKKTDNIK